MKQIIVENRNRIRAIIRKIMGTDNEDIEQEVYIRTWQNLDKYKEEGKFKQWISTITANLCRDYFKSKEYHQSIVVLDDEEVLENIKSSDKQQEEIIDAKMRQKIILKAVDSLPAKLRKIVILFEFESNVRTTAKGTDLRILSPESPMEGAVQEETTLEDVFLSYFGEKSGDEQ